MRRGYKGIGRLEVVHLPQKSWRPYNKKQQKADGRNSAYNIFPSKIRVEIDAVR